jgi:hypothetical protein
MNARTTMLHFASDTDHSAFAIRDRGSVEQFHQLGHEPLAKHSTGLKQRSQILDKFASERVPNDRHSHGPRSWPCRPVEEQASSKLTADRKLMVA